MTTHENEIKEVQASGNAKQHNGNSYTTTHNYFGQAHLRQPFRDSERTPSPQLPLVFRHAKLRSGHVRLARLMWASDESLPIRCVFKQVSHDDLQSGVSFEILSLHEELSRQDRLSIFARDNDDIKETWKCLEVTPEVHEALKELRRDLIEEIGELLVFADPICVVASDPTEWQDQLNSVGLLCKSATILHVWLGSADSSVKGALTFMNQFNFSEPFDQNEVDAALKQAYPDLLRLLEVEYFSQRWLIPMLALSCNIFLHHGPMRCSWTRFREAVNYLLRNLDGLRREIRGSGLANEFLGQDDLDVESSNAITLVQHLDDLRRGIQHDLAQLVTCFHRFEVKRARATILALLPFTDQVTRMKYISYSTRMWVDKVYENLVREHVGRTMDLDIICRPWATLPNDKRAIPSWIYGVENSPYGVPSRYLRKRINGDCLLGPRHGTWYNASRNLRATDVGSEPGSLQVTGLYFGEVQACSVVMDGVVSAKDITAMTNKSRWNILVAERADTGRKPPVEYDRAYTYCQERLSANGHLNIPRLIDKVGDNGILEVLKRMQAVVWERAFIYVSTYDSSGQMTNTLLGIGPRHTEVGDKVFVLFGCSIPCILRPSKIDDSYVLVGGAYLHGVMDGEVIAYNSLEQLERKKMSIKLR